MRLTLKAINAELAKRAGAHPVPSVSLLARLERG